MTPAPRYGTVAIANSRRNPVGLVTAVVAKASPVVLVATRLRICCGLSGYINPVETAADKTKTAGLGYALWFCMPDDWPLWLGLHHEAYRGRVEELWGWDDAQQLDFARHEFDTAYHGQFIIMVDGVDAGYLSFNWEEGALYLSNLVLSAGVRGRGLGEAILRDLQGVAATRGAGMRLQTFINNPARKLYERLGFKLVEENANKHFVMRWQA